MLVTLLKRLLYFQDHIWAMAAELPNLVRLDSLVSVGRDSVVEWSTMQTEELERALMEVPLQYPMLTLTADMVHFAHHRYCLGGGGMGLEGS